MKRHKIIATICSIWALILAGGCAGNSDMQEGKARYIFLFIGDGMSNSNIALAESYLSYKSGKFGGELLTMSQFPYHGTSSTYAADSYITDSSASGTSIACGEKTKVAYLGVDAEGQHIKSMASDLKEEDYQIGIITNAPVNHATPSSFYAHSTNRYAYYDIAKEIADCGFDFLAGTGFIDYRGRSGEEEPIDSYLENKGGYEVCYGIEELKKDGRGKDKVLFCYESNRGQNAKDYIVGTSEKEVRLGEMLQWGLDSFEEGKPFFIMCEGGTIDWCSHANKTMPAIIDILEFDEAIGIAYEFYKKRPDETLIVVTSDHCTGGPSIGADSYTVHWDVIEEQWEMDGHKNELNKEENAALNKRASIGWTSNAHTGEPVPVFAIGKGAEKFIGRMDNTEFKGKILCE